MSAFHPFLPQALCPLSTVNGSKTAADIDCAWMLSNSRAMEDTPTTARARYFLTLLRDGSPPSELVLAKALDELVLAYHDTPAGKPSEADADPPRTDYRERHQALGERFPSLGHYALADPTEAVTGKPLVGDAIDDLADIAGDLEEVLWRFEHVGADEAHWYFRMLFEIHWGRHLRELQLYLHAKMW